MIRAVILLLALAGTAFAQENETLINVRKYGCREWRIDSESLHFGIADATGRLVTVHFLTRWPPLADTMVVPADAAEVFLVCRAFKVSPVEIVDKQGAGPPTILHLLQDTNPALSVREEVIVLVAVTDPNRGDVTYYLDYFERPLLPAGLVRPKWQDGGVTGSGDELERRIVTHPVTVKQFQEFYERTTFGRVNSQEVCLGITAMPALLKHGFRFGLDGPPDKKRERKEEGN